MTKPKPTKEEQAELQAAKDLLWESGMLSNEINNRIQNKLDNLKNGTSRGAWVRPFKESESK